MSHRQGRRACVFSFDRRAACMLVMLVASCLLTGCGISAGRLQPMADRPVGVPNYAVVQAGVLERGGQPRDEGLAALQKRGVRTIVDLRRGDRSAERLQAERLGMRYVNLPMSAGKLSSKDTQDFLRIATDPAMQPVFVHCHYGADRTGAMVGMYRRRVQGWGADPTIAELHHHQGMNRIFHPQITTLLRQAPAGAGAGASHL